MKVTSTKNLDFPKFAWGIRRGEERELPSQKDAQEAILGHRAIRMVEKPVKEEKKK